MLSRHLNLDPPLRSSSWRKIAIGTWRSAKDPSVYGVLDLDVGSALRYIGELAATSGARVTITHFVGKAVAESLRRHPQVNSVLRLGRLYPRKSVSVFFQVASDGHGEDLSGTTIHHAEQKSVLDFAREIGSQVHRIRKREDRTFTRMKSLMALLPGFASSFVLDFTGLLLYALNIWSPLLGVPKDPMGSVMITNVGSLGLDMAFAPLVAYSRVPLLLAIGSIQDQPVVRDGQLAVGRIMRLCVTFDHRIIDGVHAAKLAKTLTGIFADPWSELNGSRPQDRTG